MTGATQAKKTNKRNRTKQTKAYFNVLFFIIRLFGFLCWLLFVCRVLNSFFVWFSFRCFCLCLKACCVLCLVWFLCVLLLMHVWLVFDCFVSLCCFWLVCVFVLFCWLYGSFSLVCCLLAAFCLLVYCLIVFVCFVVSQVPRKTQMFKLFKTKCKISNFQTFVEQVWFWQNLQKMRKWINSSKFPNVQQKCPDPRFGTSRVVHKNVEKFKALLTILKFDPIFNIPKIWIQCLLFGDPTFQKFKISFWWGIGDPNLQMFGYKNKWQITNFKPSSFWHFPTRSKRCKHQTNNLKLESK